MPDFRCAAVVLAAGASSRLGQPKQLIQIDGESLLHKTARLALEAGCSPVFIVLGFEATRMRPYLSGLPVEIVLNDDWREGMGSSLRSGIEAVRKSTPLPNAVLLLVCDQPHLTAGHLRDLLAFHTASPAGRETGITASVYAHTAGVPAIFPARLFSTLTAIQGDRGARDVLRAHTTDVQAIPWPGGQFDLDRPEDLIAIER